MSIVVVKIGGSIISKSEDLMIDMPFLNQFKQVILKENAQSGTKFAMITGGGWLMRKYRDLLQAGGVINLTSIHWVGTTVCVLHAMVLKSIFDTAADDDVFKFEDFYVNDNAPLKIKNVVKIGGGARPGHSSDVDALIFAERTGATTIFSLKNIDGVYEADPKLVPTAKRLFKLTWGEYLNIIGDPTEHTPGGNFPIDPIASRIAQKKGIRFIILLGSDLVNFENALAGRDFIGTIVG